MTAHINANPGDFANWCGHHFSQANWYAFGRLAWDPTLSSEQIADEWLKQTFTHDTAFINPMKEVMMSSREACVDYMMPLGLHHIFKADHHYGPEPQGFYPKYPIEWCPVYYHKADSTGIGCASRGKALKNSLRSSCSIVCIRIRSSDSSSSL